MDNPSEHLARFFHESPLAFHTVDRDGRLTSVNAAMASMLGFSVDEILGMRLSDLASVEGVENVATHLADALSASPSLGLTLTWSTKDGREVSGEAHAVGSFGPDGAYAGASAVIVHPSTQTDGPEDREAATALRESERRFRDLFENSLDSICILDAEHNYVEVNRATERLTGYSREELLRMSVADLVHPDDRDRSRETLESLQDKGSYTTYEGRILTKDGSTRHVEVSSNTIVKGGVIVGSRDILRDVTERKIALETQRDLEQQLFLSQKLESVGRLAGGVAHDFNNVLTSVMGYAELLQESFPDPDTLVGEAASVILRGAERASHLTRQLLGFARRGRYDPGPVDINGVVRDVMGISAKIFEERISVRYDLAADLPPVQGDESQLDQVLTNLIINANDAMPEGGELSVMTELYSLGAADASTNLDLEMGDYVRVTLSDTGTGMDKETMAHIFEPFFTTKDGKGTGLGLATVYGIVRNHGGAVDVYSEPGLGTRFAILLPTATEDFVEREPGPGALRGSGLILVIDDEDGVRRIATRQLESLGYSVLNARDGSEGVQRYRQYGGKIDLVLIDMVMPGMDGGDTFDALKQHDPAVKAVLTSGFTEEGRASAIIKRGLSGFIQKPFRLSELSRVINRVLSS